MRKCFTILLMLLFISINNYASERNEKLDESLLVSNQYSTLSDFNKTMSGSEEDYKLSLLNLQVDVLGPVFFGPLVSLDIQFANCIAIGPYVRWHYAGLLYQAVVTDWFTENSAVSLGSFSYGAQIKFIIPTGTGQHRPFIGVGAEKSQGKEIISEYLGGGDRINEFEQNIFHFDLGYRYTSSSAFNLSVGLGIGISQDTKQIAYNEGFEDMFDSYQLETRFLPMITLQLGWQLGK
ncbi:MAG: hypothetical protein GQ564_15715 [Bacteroidales bacterium]|nr:hypothetical protein [Bacteroidales bacterium]